MARHNDTGKRGEQLATEFLVRQGFVILHRNWRYRHLEVDIIAVKNRVLHFVEVKTRSTDRFGWPEASVTDTKLFRLMRAAQAFLRGYGYNKPVQYDVLSIVLDRTKPPQFFLIEDVYA